MRPTVLKFSWRLFLLLGLWMGCAALIWAAEGEDQLVMLHSGGTVCGIAPQIGGRIVVFRTENGPNLLDARPALWSDKTSDELESTNWKQYFGESDWSGPQSDWGTEKEPYPPKVTRPGTWPPDPAWELAPYAVLEKTTNRVVLKGPVSLFTGLQQIKTVELLVDGRLRLEIKAINQGDRVVTRDLWMIHRVSPASRVFLPLKSEVPDEGFAKTVSVRQLEGMTVFQALFDLTNARTTGGKLRGVAKEGWMASITNGVFFTVKFSPTDEAKVAPGQAPVELFFSSIPAPICELEHHGELKTLKPGEEMTSEEFWQIVPYAGPDTVEAQAKFLQAQMGRSVSVATKSS